MERYNTNTKRTSKFYGRNCPGSRRRKRGQPPRRRHEWFYDSRRAHVVYHRSASSTDVQSQILFAVQVRLAWRWAFVWSVCIVVDFGLIYFMSWWIGVHTDQHVNRKIKNFENTVARARATFSRTKLVQFVGASPFSFSFSSKNNFFTSSSFFCFVSSRQKICTNNFWKTVHRLTRRRSGKVSTRPSITFYLALHPWHQQKNPVDTIEEHLYVHEAGKAASRGESVVR